MPRLARIAAAALLLAGCQARPHVFSSGGPALADGPGGVDKVGVFVAGVDGAPEALDAALRPALAARLVELGVAASDRSAHRASYILEAKARTAPDGGRVVSWRLVDADAEIAALMEQAVPEPGAAWEDGGLELAAALAGEAARRLAALIRDAPPAPAPAALPPPRRRVAVGAVTGAPGNGAAALADAARAALSRAGIQAAVEGSGAPLLTGAVEVRRDGERDLVVLSWRLVGADGREIGTFAQEGEVAAGALDGAWGGVADAMARGAALGVAELLAAAPPPARDR